MKTFSKSSVKQLQVAFPFRMVPPLSFSALCTRFRALRARFRRASCKFSFLPARLSQLDFWASLLMMNDLKRIIVDGVHRSMLTMGSVPQLCVGAVQAIQVWQPQMCLNALLHGSQGYTDITHITQILKRWRSLELFLRNLLNFVSTATPVWPEERFSNYFFVT